MCMMGHKKVRKNIICISSVSIDVFLIDEGLRRSKQCGCTEVVNVKLETGKECMCHLSLNIKGGSINGHLKVISLDQCVHV